MNKSAAFDLLKRAAEDPTFARELLSNRDELSADRGLPEPEAREEIRQLIVALCSHGALANDTSDPKQHETTQQTAESFKSGLRKTVDQIERGFRSTMLMYEVAFYLGVGLVLAAVVMAFVSKEKLLPMVFGGLGMVDVIAYFVTKPPQDLQFSRARLAQLQAAFFNWFIDYTNWNGALMAMAQDGKLDFNTMTTVSKVLMEHTEKTMELIDKYCGSPKKGANDGARTLGHIFGNRSQRSGRTRTRGANLRSAGDPGAGNGG